MNKDYIIGNYKEKVFKVLEKLLEKLESKEDMKHHHLEKKWENHILTIYLKSLTNRYYGGVAYGKFVIKNNILNIEINELEVARLYPENNKITESFFNYIKQETLYVDKLLNDIINEVDSFVF